MSNQEELEQTAPEPSHYDIPRLVIAGTIAALDSLHPNPKIPQVGVFYLADIALAKMNQLRDGK
jgi:hypothetical protein